MRYPLLRMRRLRSSEAMRRMIRETNVTVNDFVCPIFVIYGKNKKNPVNSMPGVYQFSIDAVAAEAKQIYSLGIPAVILFGIPAHKDSGGSGAYDEDGIVQRAVKTIKDACPELLVITDVCLCEYTDHGHCGILDQDGKIQNDKTVELLVRQALSHALAGCDIVAPSDMMDGRIGVIRKALEGDGYTDTAIMSYAVKYSSAFYGPFRDAAQSAPSFGDRRTHQMDSASSLQAVRETQADIEEGADIVMVKPALAYLDVIKTVKETFGYPTAAYSVSGEYSLVKAAAEKGWGDERSVFMEIFTSIKRAGADIIISYAAKDAARWLQEHT